MTSKKEGEANNNEAAVDSAKTEKIAEKLEAMGMTGSGKKSEEVESNKMMNLMMAMIVAVPVLAIVAYILMPQQLEGMLSMSGEDENVAVNSFAAHQQIPFHQENGGFNAAQEPEWLTQRRAEMDKRHSEFEKRNADHFSVNRNLSEVPQWVKDRQAQMEQRRAEFEKQNADNYAANRNASEPPQWVKDHQAFMQKEQERQQQEWTKRAQDMSNNRAPNQAAYMANPGMNTYQPPVNNAYMQNQRPYYNAYAQPMNPYYYNNGSYAGPRDLPYGYPYR